MNKTHKKALRKQSAQPTAEQSKRSTSSKVSTGSKGQASSSSKPHSGKEQPERNVKAPAQAEIENPTRIISSVSLKKADGTDEKCVSITFDDGPSPEYTPAVLALLKEHKVRATFCVVGRQVKKHPDLIRQIVAEGHQIANHSMNHDEFLPNRTNAKLEQEVHAENALIESVVPGTKIEFFRAPAGNWNLRLRKLAVSWGMKPLGWSVDTRDWQQPGTKAIVATVNAQLKPGGIILMHDGGGNRNQTVEALKQILPDLKEQGYTFVLPQYGSL